MEAIRVFKMPFMAFSSLVQQNEQVVSIDDYAKDGGPGRSDFCVVFTMSLCKLELIQMLIILLFQVIRP